MNLYRRFVDSARQHAERTVLLWDDGSMTYEELLSRAQRMAGIIARHVTTDMPNVGLLAPNTLFFPIALLGTLGAGGVIVPFNPLLQIEELEVLIKHSGMRTLLYDPNLKEKADALGERFGESLRLMDIQDALQSAATPAESLDRDLPNGASTSMILYTSGTTGDPKGVMLSHRNVSTNVDGCIDALDFGKEDTFQVVLPMFHTFAMTVCIFTPLFAGASMRLFVQFDPKKLLEAMTTDSSALLAAVPPMLMMLARLAPDDYADRHRVRLFVSGGGPLPVEVAHAVKSKTGIDVYEGYGLTETSPVVGLNRPGSNRIGTIGLPLPNVEARICDENGTEVPLGEVGELCVRGSLVMQGYYRNEEATKAVLSEDGWLRTGDMARFLDDGFLQIVGRCKDLIIDSGENIYPREIEEVLMKHPTVLEAAVVGRPHRLRGEVPFAFVTAHPESPEPPDPSALRAYCREHLAAFKVPEEVQLIDAFQKTATNKIRKEFLRKMLA